MRPYPRQLPAPALPALAILLLLAAPAEPLAGQDSAGRPDGERVEDERLLGDLRVLAHDSMQGRRTGHQGNRRARGFLLLAFDRAGLEPVEGIRSQEFRFTSRRDGEEYGGLNIMGLVPGTQLPERYIVVTAHYDHLGVQDGEIYNGADDNASGTAALLELARYFREAPPRHSVIFVALDAEELGLEGARTWVEVPPVPLEHVVMNVNLDMVGRSEEGVLYAAGTHHYPFLRSRVEEVAGAGRVALRMGHDSPDLPPGDDWTHASDHGPFHERNIPFIYFGVEDHAGYHHSTDTFENITPGFYVNAVETILDFLLVVDRDGEAIGAARDGFERAAGATAN